MILFRVDGNSNVGLGHIMRCLSIANAFNRAEKECMFVLADDNAKIIIEDRGFRTIILQTQFNELENEEPVFESILKEVGPELLIVDSYYVTRKYLYEIRQLCKLAYIDDLADFAYPVDVLINYNVYGMKLKYREIYDREGIKFPQTLLGMDYVPLREEYRNLYKHNQQKRCKDILVSTGGADPIHLAFDFVKYLKDNNLEMNYNFHIILGAMNLDKEKIYKLSRGMENIIVHQNVQDMSSLMMSCDLAISAAGSTLYELCACGLPAITYVLADNQTLGAETFQKMNLMISLGDVRKQEDITRRLYTSIVTLDADFDRRKTMAETMQKMVDGYGADRLVDALIYLS